MIVWVWPIEKLPLPRNKDLRCCNEDLAQKEDLYCRNRKALAAATKGQALTQLKDLPQMESIESPSNPPMGSAELLSTPIGLVDKIYQKSISDGPRKQSAKDLKEIISSIASQFRSATTANSTTEATENPHPTVAVPSLNALQVGFILEGTYKL